MTAQFQKILKYYHPDHLGSSSLITDTTRALMQHLEYVPFGEVFIDERATTNGWGTPFKFNGKEQDEETGLYYYGARYYDSKTSVFLSVDPLYSEYPFQSPYVYAANNPVRYIDWMGMGPEDKVFGQGQVGSLLLYARQNIARKKSGLSYGYGIGDRHDCITSVTYGTRHLNRDMGIKAGTPMTDQMRILQGAGYAGKRYDFNFSDKDGNQTTGVAEPIKLGNSIAEKMIELSDQEDGTYVFGLSLADDYHSALVLLDKKGDENTFTFIDQNKVGEELSGEYLDKAFSSYVKNVRKTVDTKTTISIWQYTNLSKQEPLQKLKPIQMKLSNVEINL